MASIVNHLVRIHRTYDKNEISTVKLANYTICRGPNQVEENRKRKLLMEFNQQIPELAEEEILSLCLQFSVVLYLIGDKLPIQL